MWKVYMTPNRMLRKALSGGGVGERKRNLGSWLAFSEMVGICKKEDTRKGLSGSAGKRIIAADVILAKFGPVFYSERITVSQWNLNASSSNKPVIAPSIKSPDALQHISIHKPPGKDRFAE
jgi:hypothetical protein